MSDPDPEMTVVVAPIDESLLSYTHVMYALHSLAVLIGVTTFHTIVGSFIGSLPSIVAVVMNYVRRSATRDRKSTRLNSSHDQISYAVFCLKKKKNTLTTAQPRL